MNLGETENPESPILTRDHPDPPGISLRFNAASLTFLSSLAKPANRLFPVLEMILLDLTLYWLVLT